MVANELKTVQAKWACIKSLEVNMITSKNSTLLHHEDLYKVAILRKNLTMELSTF